MCNACQTKVLQALNSDYLSFEKGVIERRTLREDDVAIDIKFCGICHSDIHMVDNDMGNAVFPMVPGHEIAGVVSAVGSKVTKFEVGDPVGVGCFVDSCGVCEYCMRGDEQFCTKGVVVVFNSTDYDGNTTYGGYAKSIVVKDRFVVAIPEAMDLAHAAPMLCAGITTYAPMKKWHVGPGKRVAILGMGGLGHIAIQFAHKLGAEVTVLGHSAVKKDEAVKFGADAYHLTSDPQTFTELKGRFDFILNTLAIDLDVNAYLDLLRVDGAMVYVGLANKPQEFSVFGLIFKEAVLTGSNVGGLALTQEMINFAAENGVLPQIEMISIDQVSEAYQRILKSDVRYRFVIDMATL